MDDTETEETPERPWYRRLLTEWVLPLLALLLAITVLGRLRAPDLDEVAPDFTLHALSGEDVTLSALQGRTVVINFWATWCGPCRAEIPSFSKFATNHPEVTILGVAADGPEPKVRAFAKKMEMTYPVLMADRETLAAYGVDSYPTTIVVEPDGTVKSAHVGVMFGPQLWYATRPWSL